MFSPIWIGVRIEIRDERAMDIVVVPDRFLDPIDALVIERAAPLHGRGEGQRLIEIEHERGVRGNPFAHGPHNGKISRGVLPSDPKFDGLESLREKLFSFVRRLLGGDEAETVAVVGGYRLRRRAEKRRERKIHRQRHCVPGGHIDSGGNHRKRPGEARQPEKAS